ncbi:complex I subunit 5 family protein [Hydrogenophaga sp.]|uniref:complex I subunit 5 family protein n=1 Tax=Hydrogenophaga sp. TaxID=1904254 RepID=UPI002723DBAB|nr:proton-conducting transporter membrane subunit [Hydrogenophaga sp.]MDO8904813.1 proton-conducting transporter membrane subunit [Hydrogenophaga sp.]
MTDTLLTAQVWPVLSIALPLGLALLAVCLPRAARLLLVPAMLGMLVLAAGMAVHVWRGGPMRVQIGGWDAPLGIALVVEGLSGAFVLTAAIVMAAVMWQARSDFPVQRGKETRAAFAFWPLTWFLWAALTAVFLSGDLFNLYVGLELLTLGAIALVAIDGKPPTVAAAIRYALFALPGSLLYLLGTALLYAAHGTLDIALLGERIGEPDAATLAAGALMTAGLAAKTALFPFHAWLPPAHAGAPAPASAMLSALVPKASFYIVLRLWFDVMPQAAGAWMPQLLGAMGAMAIVYGSVLAVRQDRLKLLIAYSTVAQIGYLFLLFPLAGGGGPAQPWYAGAWTGGVFHALSHASAKAAMFLCAGLFVQAIGHDRISGLQGIARTMPMTTFAFALAAVSLMGLPPSGGFISKYLMLTAAFAGGQIVWAVFMLLGGLLAAMYLFRPLTLAFAKGGIESSDLQVVKRGRQVVPVLLAATAILLGIASALPYDFLQIGRPVAADEGLG